MLVVSLCFDAGASVHVWAEHLGNRDRSVGVLVALEEGNQNSWGGDAGVVEGVGELCFPLSIFVTKVQAACLELVEH